MDAKELPLDAEADVLVKRPPIITVLCGLQFLKFFYLLNTATDSRTQELFEQLALPEHYALIRFVVGLVIFIGVAAVWNLKRWGTWVFWAAAGLSLIYGIFVHESRLYMHIDDLAFGIVCWHYYRGLRE